MQTLRLHYANCNTYNADFDGDEMNLHLPQNEHCRAEAAEIAFANRQYCSGTDGSPLRGLIQDHVDMGVLLTQQNTFLSKAEYVQLVYGACTAMASRVDQTINLVPPAVLKPKKLWTGKQVITTLLMHLIGSTDPKDLLTMGPSRTKISAKVWKVYPKLPLPENPEECQVRQASLKLIGGVDGLLGQTKVVVRQGILCSGVLDKAHFGSSSYGLVHCVHGKLKGLHSSMLYCLCVLWRYQI